MVGKKKGLDFKDLVRDEVTRDPPEQFLKWLEVEKHYSPNTVYQYRCDLKLIDDYAKAIKKDLQDLSYQNLFSYLRILKEKKGYQARTMARKIACMKSFYKWLVREKVLEHSPAEAIESPKLPRGIPMALNHEQMDQLLSHTRSLTYNLEGKRDNCLMHFLFYLGLRVSELSGLRLDNLKKDDQGGRYVQLYGKGNKERKIPLHREAERALELYLSMRPDTSLATCSFPSGEGTDMGRPRPAPSRGWWPSTGRSSPCRRNSRPTRAATLSCPAWSSRGWTSRSRGSWPAAPTSRPPWGT